MRKVTPAYMMMGTRPQRTYISSSDMEEYDSTDEWGKPKVEVVVPISAANRDKMRDYL